MSVLERSNTGLEENMKSAQWEVSELKDELLQRHRENMALGMCIPHSVALHE